MEGYSRDGGFQSKSIKNPAVCYLWKTQKCCEHKNKTKKIRQINGKWLRVKAPATKTNGLSPAPIWGKKRTDFGKLFSEIH